MLPFWIKLCSGCVALLAFEQFCDSSYVHTCIMPAKVAEKVPLAASSAGDDYGDDEDTCTTTCGEIGQLQKLVGKILLGQPFKQASVDMKVLAHRAGRIANVAKMLADHPDKIEFAEVSLRGDNSKSLLKGKKSGKKAEAVELARLNESSTFDSDTVETLADAPPVWLWAVLEKRTKGGISAEVKAAISQKSGKPLRKITTFVAGWTVEAATPAPTIP
eukprot:128253-Pyramimonas_sp.AAC.1